MKPIVGTALAALVIRIILWGFGTFVAMLFLGAIFHDLGIGQPLGFFHPLTWGFGFFVSKIMFDLVNSN